MYLPSCTAKPLGTTRWGCDYCILVQKIIVTDRAILVLLLHHPEKTSFIAQKRTFCCSVTIQDFIGLNHKYFIINQL